MTPTLASDFSLYGCLRNRVKTRGQTLDVWKAAIGLGRVTDRFSLSFGYTRTWSAQESGYIDGAGYEVSLHEFYTGATWFY